MSGILRGNGWGICFLPRPQATKRLFCFPYAGGSASVFRAWSETLPSDIEVWAVQLPGRENRWHEAAYTKTESLVPHLAEAIQLELDRPFAFFGHSMGALIAFELVRFLRDQSLGRPIALFVSGCRAPHLPRSHKAIHNLPSAEFQNEIRQLNGTPKQILQNEELMVLLLDMLRADFTLSETYAYIEESPLSIPVVAFAGLEDEIARPAEVEAWKEETSGDFDYHLLPGSHFFLHSARPRLLQLLGKEMDNRAESNDGIFAHILP